MDIQTDTSGEILNLSVCEEGVDVAEIRELLPPWRTHILEAKIIDKDDFPKLSLRFLLNANSIEEIQKWLVQLQENNKTTYSIHCTPKSAGKYVLFKQRLQCQHKTRSKNVYDPSVKRNNTKNTNCPSRIAVALHAIKEPYQGKYKEKAALVRDMPCEVTFIATHNHPTISGDSLRFRKMSEEVKEKLLDLFHKGHSAATALELIKMDIKLNTENYEEILADRKYCPTYHDCYQLLRKEFKEKFGTWEFDGPARESLKRKLEEFNEEMKDDCARIMYQESAYVICICPPLFKRVHQHVPTCSELVFVHSSGPADHDGSHIITLLTNSDCGGLPLGVIITSSESTDLVSCGFKLLQEMVGGKIFGGQVEGPKIFITYDSLPDRAALNDVWPKSRNLLCTFHVLQSVWRWLIKMKNGIPREKQLLFFTLFKNILHAPTVKDFFTNFVEARKEAIDFPKYDQFLLEYWNRRELWAKAYRSNLTYRGNPINDCSEEELTMLEDRIFSRVKAFNVVQMVDFVLTRLVTYYKLRLLDAAHNRRTKDIFRKSVPPLEILERIHVLDNNLVLVPNKTDRTVLYTVNMEVLVCGCFEGTTGGRCRHVDWASAVVNPEKWSIKIYDVATRELMFFIANGIPALTPLDTTYDEIFIDYFGQDQTMFEVRPEEEISCDSGNDSCAEAIKEKARAILANINSDIINFIDSSPSEVVTGLEALQKTLQEIKDPASFVSHCVNFGSHRNHNNNYLGVQNTTIDRRKNNVSEGVGQVDAAPVQYITLLINNEHNLIS